MGIGAELCVVSTRNPLVRSEGEQGEISEEKDTLIPALRQATRGVWGTRRNNIVYAPSYLGPCLPLLPRDAVKISALPSQPTPLKLQISPVGATCPVKVVSVLEFTDCRWKPSVFSYVHVAATISFGDALVQPFSAHRDEEEGEPQHRGGIWGFALSQEAMTHTK